MQCCVYAGTDHNLWGKAYAKMLVIGSRKPTCLCRGQIQIQQNSTNTWHSYYARIKILRSLLIYSTYFFGVARTFIFYHHVGVRIGLFTPGAAFEVVAKKQISYMKEPSTKVVELVTEELRKICREGLDKVPLHRVGGILGQTRVSCIFVMYMTCPKSCKKFDFLSSIVKAVATNHPWVYRFFTYKLGCF